MPWTPKQHRMAEGCAHNPSKMTKVKCPSKTVSKKMASEGIKKSGRGR